ncbi:hypothetical protein HYH03_014195 [Edaphochlamys debaryana]|uniref:Uncharacterized protein n=1 Tax=Edaphochlamys debaryana TaxID=47281 RepID=A0A835XPL5_9CHLO|nr:hypothetical protein HYH03_014195 [Edaphochlamys debaryana]|eukprot:KAG2487222.1 hypothetical protein HYH03_014195 [Edaphochlamys debaryana]
MNVDCVPLAAPGPSSRRHILQGSNESVETTSYGGCQPHTAGGSGLDANASAFSPNGMRVRVSLQDPSGAMNVIQNAEDPNAMISDLKDQVHERIQAFMAELTAGLEPSETAGACVPPKDAVEGGLEVQAKYELPLSPLGDRVFSDEDTGCASDPSASLGLSDGAEFESGVPSVEQRPGGAPGAPEPSESRALAAWVVPVAVVGGAALLLALVAGVIARKRRHDKVVDEAAAKAAKLAQDAAAAGAEGQEEDAEHAAERSGYSNAGGAAAAQEGNQLAAGVEGMAVSRQGSATSDGPHTPRSRRASDPGFWALPVHRVRSAPPTSAPPFAAAAGGAVTPFAPAAGGAVTPSAPAAGGAVTPFAPATPMDTRWATPGLRAPPTAAATSATPSSPPLGMASPTLPMPPPQVRRTHSGKVAPLPPPLPQLQSPPQAQLMDRPVAYRSDAGGTASAAAAAGGFGFGTAIPAAIPGSLTDPGQPPAVAGGAAGAAAGPAASASSCPASPAQLPIADGAAAAGGLAAAPRPRRARSVSEPGELSVVADGFAAAPDGLVRTGSAAAAAAASPSRPYLDVVPEAEDEDVSTPTAAAVAGGVPRDGSPFGSEGLPVAASPERGSASAASGSPGGGAGARRSLPGGILFTKRRVAPLLSADGGAATALAPPPPAALAAVGSAGSSGLSWAWSVGGGPRSSGGSGSGDADADGEAPPSGDGAAADADGAAAAAAAEALEQRMVSLPGSTLEALWISGAGRRRLAEPSPGELGMGGEAGEEGDQDGGGEAAGRRGLAAQLNAAAATAAARASSRRRLA